MSLKVTNETLGGFAPATPTPFDEEGRIEEDSFRALIDYLKDIGARSICVSGDNGESWTLNAAERRRLTELAVEQAGGDLPIMTGVSAPSRAATVEYARAAADGGASALLLMPQTYVMKASRDELVRRFEAVAKAVNLPIVLYNSPRRTSIELSMEDIAALMDVSPIVGIKESHRDFFHLTRLIETYKDKIAIMIGPCHYILPGLALGAKGFIATGPELLGKEAAEICDIAQKAPGEAYAAMHFKLTRIYQLLMGTGTWPSSFKAALNLKGLPAGVPRDPILPLAGGELEKLRAEMESLGVL